MYIKREDMHSAIEKDTNFGWYTSDGSVAFSKSEVHEMLNTIPAADVAEVKHGKWIKPTNEPYTMLAKCSVCGFDLGFITNFCPNCGADMRGE